MHTLESLVSELRALCAHIPGAEEYIMVHHPAFRAGKKPFAVAGLGTGGKEPTLCINLGHLAQADLLEEDGRFTRTPYIGRHGWVTIHRSDATAQEVADWVQASWRRVATQKMLAAADSK